MVRQLDLDNYTDGRKYTRDDKARIACDDCKGCSKCCQNMGKSIIVDPWDVKKLKARLNTNFDGLLQMILELNMVDGLLLPNIKMQENTDACVFLNNNGRCNIHEDRPGFCRMFPLGRLYEGDDFFYINQVHECTYKDKEKIKIKKWIDVDDIDAYENFQKEWHNFLTEKRKEIIKNPDNIKDICMEVLKYYN
ncbi:MAG: YkgJ family cysteine cluster protein [Lachnospiraceae bacterium]|nr:YkgJ family cysteine cluster protein [Lachnospiraceae bacterium]